MEMGMNALIRSLLWLEAKDSDGNWHGIADNMTLLLLRQRARSVHNCERNPPKCTYSWFN